MAQLTGAFSSYDGIGNREHLTDVIYDISPTETPVLSACRREKAKATYVEWQTDSLAAAAQNAKIDGDAFTFSAPAATTRVGNYTQISYKLVRITGTQEAVDKAGRKSEMAYQMAKRAKELKRDMENDICDNNAQVAGNDTTARELGGLGSWVATNDDFGSGGASPTGDGTNARTDGTQRAFTEASLKGALEDCFTNGGNPSMLVVGPFNKQVVSGFSGNSTRFDKGEDKKLVAAIDVYVSDFGELRVVPDRFSRARDAWLLDPEHLSVAYLRPFETKDVARTGDGENKSLIVEYTLCVKNEKAHGLVADLTTS